MKNKRFWRWMRQLLSQSCWWCCYLFIEIACTVVGRSAAYIRRVSFIQIAFYFFVIFRFWSLQYFDELVTGQYGHTTGELHTESTGIEWFKEDQALSPSYDFTPAPPPLPSISSPALHTGRLRKRDNLLTGEGGGGRGRSQIIRRLLSRDVCKSFNTPWLHS